MKTNRLFDDFDKQFHSDHAELNKIAKNMGWSIRWKE